MAGQARISSVPPMARVRIVDVRDPAYLKWGTVGQHRSSAFVCVVLDGYGALSPLLVQLPVDTAVEVLGENEYQEHRADRETRAALADARVLADTIGDAIGAPERRP